MFPHNAGTSTPISASLLRRAFKLHLLPVPPPPLALPLVGEELPVLEVVPCLWPARRPSAVVVPALAAMDPVTPLLVPVVLGMVLLARPWGGVEDVSPEMAPGRSGEQPGGGAAAAEAALLWGMPSSPSSSSPRLSKHGPHEMALKVGDQGGKYVQCHFVRSVFCFVL